MLYIVPDGIDDDLFCIYSTVYEKRKTRGYVVTNDLYRDHKIAFLEPRPFIRWRMSQVVFFNIDIDAKPKEEVTLYAPGEFAREIQRADGVDFNGHTRWHIPSIDRNVWLCIGTGAGNNGTTNEKH
jgi:hypothetical protein